MPSTSLMQTIDAVQVLNFPINSASQLPWGGTAVEPLALTLDVVSGDFIGRPSLFTLFVIALVLSILWTGLFVGLSISVGEAISAWVHPKRNPMHSCRGSNCDYIHM